MATELDAAMDKIARLKTLAERPGTPEEAAAAVAGIQRLMRRWNLTQMEVNAATRNTERGFDKFAVDLGATLKWRQSLMYEICLAGYCTFVQSHRGNGGSIVGEKHNVVVAKELYEYLVEEIERLAAERWQDARHFAWETSRTFKHAFKVGAAVAVTNRIKEDARAEKKAQEEGTSALVVVYEDDLKNAVSQYFPNLSYKSSTMNTRSSAGYADGKRAGAGINLAKQIGGK